LQHAAAAGPLPVFGTLKVDAHGDVWVGAYLPPLSDQARTPVRFDVLTPGAEWLGTVSLPPPSEFHLLAVGADRLIGVAKDSLDVQAVVAYALRRQEH
jgi:hypothetical protein